MFYILKININLEKFIMNVKIATDKKILAPLLLGHSFQWLIYLFK
jgi:hypothetical protein